MYKAIIEEEYYSNILDKAICSGKYVIDEKTRKKLFERVGSLNNKAACIAKELSRLLDDDILGSACVIQLVEESD